MSEQLAVQAEIEKLSRLLDTDADQLESVRQLPASTIHELSAGISQTLHDAGKDKLQRIAAASKIVPAPMAAAFAQRYFGPLLCARVAVMLDPGKATDLAKRLPAPFLAQVSLHLDPRRAERIIAKIPDDLVVAVARELISAREFITMGRFVGYVSLNAMLRAIEHATAEELLRVAFFVEAQERFDELAAALPDDRIGALIRAAAADGLWVEALSLIDAVGPESRARIANIAGAQDNEVLTSMASTVHELHLYEVILPLVTMMDTDNRKRLAELPFLHQPEVLTAIVATAGAHGLWADLLPLADMLPEDALARVAAAAAEMPTDVLESIINAAHEHQQWPALLSVAERMDDKTRSELIGLMDTFPNEVIIGFVEGATVSPELVDRALALLDSARSEHVDRVLERVSTLDSSARELLTARANEIGVLDRLGPLGAALKA